MKIENKIRLVIMHNIIKIRMVSILKILAWKNILLFQCLHIFLNIFHARKRNFQRNVLKNMQRFLNGGIRVKMWPSIHPDIPEFDLIIFQRSTISEIKLLIIFSVIKGVHSPTFGTLLFIKKSLTFCIRSLYRCLRGH